MHFHKQHGWGGDVLFVAIGQVAIVGFAVGSENEPPSHVVHAVFFHKYVLTGNNVIEGTRCFAAIAAILILVTHAQTDALGRSGDGEIIAV